MGCPVPSWLREMNHKTSRERSACSLSPVMTMRLGIEIGVLASLFNLWSSGIFVQRALITLAVPGVLSTVFLTRVNLLLIAPQRAGRISWRPCIRSYVISTEDSSSKPKAFPRPSNMSLLEEKDCVHWRGPGQPWAGQVLWGFRRSRSLSPRLHCRPQWAWPPCWARMRCGLVGLMYESVVLPWREVPCPCLLPSGPLGIRPSSPPLTLPPAFPSLPSSLWLVSSSLIRQARKWAHSLSGGAVLACLQNESRCFAWQLALSSKKQSVISQPGHSPPFWEHGDFVIQKHSAACSQWGFHVWWPRWHVRFLPTPCACNLIFSFSVNLGELWAAIGKEESRV